MESQISNFESPILLIGIGNKYRSDDGIGLEIACRLKALNLPGIKVMEETGEGTTLLEAWKGVDRVILFDAICSGAMPGTIYRFDARNQSIPAKFFHHSTHALGIPEAIELARALHQLPTYLIVYGIEGKNFTAGLGFSSEVEAAAQEVVKQVLREIQPLLLPNMHSKNLT
ncbi:MAG TPA: hydrogenase maturation protease [Candidatus Limnocylindrales bacterium]|nr:hydrogenase maturation protease [Candidatus Limnocylindrales bacterium]